MAKLFSALAVSGAILASLTACYPAADAANVPDPGPRSVCVTAPPSPDPQRIPDPSCTVPPRR